MGVIKYGIFKDKYKGKDVKIRILVEGHYKDDEFIITNQWLNVDDLVNIGIINKTKEEKQNEKR